MHVEAFFLKDFDSSNFSLTTKSQNACGTYRLARQILQQESKHNEQERTRTQQLI